MGRKEPNPGPPESNRIMQAVELGDRVKDQISGVKGIVIGITNWLYGCRRIAVQPEETKDGKPADMSHIDEPQLVILKKSAVKDRRVESESTRPHGPREDAKSRPGAVR